MLVELELDVALLLELELLLEWLLELELLLEWLLLLLLFGRHGLLGGRQRRGRPPAP